YGITARCATLAPPPRRTCFAMRNAARRPRGWRNARIRKSDARHAPAEGTGIRPRAQDSQRERPPAAVTSSSDGGWEDGDDERSWLSARDLLHDIKRRGAALLEIAECEDAGAKLCERPVLGQCKTAHLLRCLFFARGFDFAPVVLGIPLAVGPMLHLVSS